MTNEERINELNEVLNDCIIYIDNLKGMGAISQYPYNVNRAKQIISGSQDYGLPWINVVDALPEINEEMDSSDNVLAICDGKLCVMAYSYIDDGEDNSGYEWCNCYGDIYGDTYFDDDYKVTHWMPLPKPPKI